MKEINNKSNKAYLGFSLVEVLMSILIVSLLMIAMAPILTKSIFPPKLEGVIYTYKADNITNNDNRCYLTDINYSNYAETFNPTKECSQYTFTVPNGVNRVNITLVAGGGGGGGAGGERYIERRISNTTSTQTTETFNLDMLKSIKINLLSAQGKKGSAVNTTTRVAGNGGNSSPLIYDFLLPVEYIKYNYINPIFQQNSESKDGKITILGGQNPSISIGDNIKYSIQNTSSAYTVSCTIGTNQYTLGTNINNFIDNCRLQDKNFINSIQGQTASAVASTSILPISSVIKGGEGGKLPYGVYGNGGSGGDLQLIKCNDSSKNNLSCAASNGTYIEYSAPKAGTNGIADVTYTTVTTPHVGGGGAGGAAIKIIAMNVKAGHTYTIYVGKGGKGGNSGAPSAHAIGAGTNGDSGVSSAIYDDENNLVYMVTGGAGGQGAATTAKGKSGRNIPKVIYLTEVFGNSIPYDREKLTLGDDSTITMNGQSVHARALNYTFFNNEPYRTLNMNGNNTVDNRTGGFDYFDIADYTIPTGFYNRTLVNNFPSYVGGLGGFSGLGSKGGCGGYFMGNFDGRTTVNTPSNTEIELPMINKFKINNVPYNVTDYYEGCSNNTPNGHSPKLVIPAIGTNIEPQAGSGGGGGGYNILYGSGSGGNGQDGYVMIEWRR